MLLLLYRAMFTVFTAPLKAIVVEALQEVLVDYAVDDPGAGGLEWCCKCRTETLYGICPECQPMKYARLP
jgi:hypothetical protein